MRPVSLTNLALGALVGNFIGGETEATVNSSLLTLGSTLPLRVNVNEAAPSMGLLDGLDSCGYQCWSENMIGQNLNKDLD